MLFALTLTLTSLSFAQLPFDYLYAEGYRVPSKHPLVRMHHHHHVVSYYEFLDKKVLSTIDPSGSQKRIFINGAYEVRDMCIVDDVLGIWTLLVGIILYLCIMNAL